MFDEIKKQFTSVKILIAMLIIAVGLYLLQIAVQLLGNFSEIIIILISSWLLSFILDPLVEKQQTYLRLPRYMATTFVYVLLFGLIGIAVLLFAPAISMQTQTLIRTLPTYMVSAPPFLRQSINAIAEYFTSFSVVFSLAQFFFDFFLVLIISFYFILDREAINKEFYNLMPKKWHSQMDFVQKVIDTNFASFVRVQILFGIVAGVTTWIVLQLFNVAFAAPAALLAGILMIIPLIGPFLALIPPLFIPILTNTTQAVLIFIVLLAIQQVIVNIIGPKLLSKAFALHPVIVLLSFLIGYKIAGPTGAVFAVPVLGIITVIIHQLSQYWAKQNNRQL